jgi:hypothetical protein
MVALVIVVGVLAGVSSAHLLEDSVLGLNEVTWQNERAKVSHPHAQ